MRNIYFYCGKFSIFFYIFSWYQLWHLCQYGGIRSHLPMLLLGIVGFVINISLWLFHFAHREEESASSGIKKIVLVIEILLVLFSTVYFTGRIVYSAIPYNGALSWKIEEWRDKKEIKLEHNNFFETGVEGILSDLDEKLNLPKSLYVANEFRMTFDAAGNIQTIYTFLYGKDEDGEARSFLVDYNASQSEKMEVWVDGTVNSDYHEDMKFNPMRMILQEALDDCRQQVQDWSGYGEGELFEILYFGSRSFGSSEGLHYISGDANGDGEIVGGKAIEMLRRGGEVKGYEVSLHIPENEVVTPVRYIMEPEYISAEKISAEQEDEQIQDSKEAEGWSVDSSNGSVYFFLDGQLGWRLVVVDAALGTRYYGLEKTTDGGSTWSEVTGNPYNGNGGVAEGLLFFDENLGCAGLAGASAQASTMYITNDSGVTFTEVKLPYETVTELPETAEEYGHTAEEYDYLNMPTKSGEVLTIHAVSEAGSTEGLIFQSTDNGKTWIYAGII